MDARIESIVASSMLCCLLLKLYYRTLESICFFVNVDLKGTAMLTDCWTGGRMRPLSICDVTSDLSSVVYDAIVFEIVGNVPYPSIVPVRNSKEIRDQFLISMK